MHRHGVREALRGQLEEESRLPSLQTVLDTFEQGVVVHSNFTVLRTNEAAARMLGVERAEALIGLPLTEVATPMALDVMVRRLESLTREGVEAAATGVQLRRLDPMQTPFEVEVSSLRLPDRLDGKAMFVSILTPLATGSEKSANLRFAAQYEHLREAAFHLEDGHIVRANAVAASLTGYSQGELMGLAFAQLVPEALRDRHGSMFERFLEEGVEARLTLSMLVLRRDARTVPAELTLTRAYLGCAEASVVATIRSASPWQDTERALRESEARYRALFDLPHHGLFVCDPAGTCLDVNPAGARMLGYTCDELLGRPLHDVVLGDEHPLLADGRAQVNVREMRRKDGVVLQVEIAASRVGGLVQAVVRDITEQRRTADALSRATRLDDLGRLAGGVVHDFNNMLTVMFDLTRELRARVHPDGLEAVEELNDVIHRASALTRSLLAGAREAPAAPSGLDINAELRGLTPLMQRTMRNASLQLALTDQPLTVGLEAVQFEQVVLNLVVNARDAMRAGGLLRIATFERDSSVVLEVSDSGEGMSPETLARVFEPFFTTKAEGRGTGLGLATVWNVVTEAGGTLQVRSNLGEGTTVTVTLPACSR